MGYIYKISNDINDKIYIGQTITSIKTRYRNHIKDIKNRDNSKLHRAMIKYGISHFKIKVIEECDKDKLDEREIYYISLYNSVKNGYNISLGGLGTNKISNEEREKWCEEYRNGKTVKEIAKEFNRSLDTIMNYVSNMKDYKKYKSKHYTNALIKQHRHPKPCNERAVVQFDLNGNFIKSFPSINEASRQTKANPTAIREVCIKRHKTCGGSQWRYEEDDNIPGSVIVYGTRKVYQYDKNMNLVKVYKNQNAAAKENNFEQTSIWRSLKNEVKTAYGYIWRYELL